VKIVRLLKTSLVDFPGVVSSVVFFAGCNLRCPWCHNRELVLGSAEYQAEALFTEYATGANLISPENALAHIKKRRDVLGGVVLSGGEPCLYENLPEFIAEIKKLTSRYNSPPLLIKLDTNGTVPAMLEKLFRKKETSPDLVALDLKIAPNRYGEIGGGDLAEAAIKKSAALILAADIAHEYRTLALPKNFVSEKDIEALAALTDNAPWYFRPFRGGNCIDPLWNGLEENPEESSAKIKALADVAASLGKNVVVPARL
jgi:pyruvate formate lyase activating enzyme